MVEGFKQKHGVNYLETFSPTANAASIRLIVALACKFGRELLHLDIEQAFVQSELDREVCMKLPQGCGSMSGKIGRLGKSLYGLRQASRTFRKTFCVGFEEDWFRTVFDGSMCSAFRDGQEGVGNACDSCG